jgi:CYTH domain-containing protein
MEGLFRIAMHTEIERKFLVNLDIWKPSGAGTYYKQGYISSDDNCVVRVRIAGDKAFFCIKALVANFTRHEFEYEIPVEDAERLLELFCKKPLIEKHRHKENHHGKLWEIDVFHAENEGLVVAEIELEREDEEVELPVFVTKEVSTDARYFNFNLQKSPFRVTF